MTTTLEQLPGPLPIKLVDGNDLSFKIDWATDTSAYTFTAFITPVGSVTTPVVITITPINALVGTYTASVTKTLLAPLAMNVNHKWRLDRTSGGITRTMLAGEFYITDK
jgi:hypothetical protein